MIDRILFVLKNLIIGSVLGVLVYFLGILQAYYIYFDFIPFIMNVFTPLIALFIEIFFITTKNKSIIGGFFRITVQFIVMFLLTGCNYSIYLFVVDKFKIYESPMIDNTAGLYSLLYMLFVVVGTVLAMIIIVRKRKTMNQIDEK